MLHHKFRSTAICHHHTLFDQLLREQLFTRLYTLNLLTIVQNPAKLLPILHNQLMLRPMLPEYAKQLI